jgi:hypothetical protein
MTVGHFCARLCGTILDRFHQPRFAASSSIFVDNSHMAQRHQFKPSALSHAARREGVHFIERL